MPENKRSIVEINEALLGKNDELAKQNRQRFNDLGILVINLLSSPGSGKTTFLSRTLSELKDKFKMAVIVGDLATDNDARRLRGHGSPVVQVVTGGYCHLESSMISEALGELDIIKKDILFIENVGNLVCPCSYDLGEDFRVALLSVTEGEDKPLKYPSLFKSADVAVITKIDLAAIVECNLDEAVANTRRAAPQATIIQTSAKTGEGMDLWYSYVEKAVLIKKNR